MSNERKAKKGRLKKLERFVQKEEGKKKKQLERNLYLILFIWVFPRSPTLFVTGPKFDKWASQLRPTVTIGIQH